MDKNLEVKGIVKAEEIGKDILFQAKIIDGQVRYYSVVPETREEGHEVLDMFGALAEAVAQALVQKNAQQCGHFRCALRSVAQEVYNRFVREATAEVIEHLAPGTDPGSSVH